MFLCVTNWFKLGSDSGVFEKPGDHADEMETSLILHLTPELVLPKEDWGEGKEFKNKIKAFSEGWAWTERPWSKVTQDTGVGDPSKATKEKGETFFNLVCAKMGKLLVDISNADINDLYQ